ncbi:helix-turn-helix transcriptional regulator [Vreelandella gomseomensis]|uniref:Helix-turn-helix transcriptional regulator n=1 Tax=Vreelandella gomseomensis TaxID=370766 RepID=A0ABU1GB05_9GAMM|nr:helix-turn-helix transcriptional regulator [Halomonas gomseomensis]MDR5874631.1 helix-turn-helix transcriptional regulator [Halomonas gomseomensis]
MTLPMIPPELASSEEAPIIMSVIKRSNDVRETGSHCHSRGQLLGATHGLISIDAGECRWVVPATHGVWIPPNVKHSLLGSHGPFNGWSIYVAEPACTDLPDKQCVLELSGLLREAVNRATLWEYKELEPAQIRLANVIIDEIRTMRNIPLGLPLPKDTRSLKVAMALSDNPGDDRCLEDWAVWAGVSSRTLRRLFTKETGFNFTEWRQRARLLKSLEMLAAGKNVTTIALDLNYENVSAFIALFRRTFGATPGHYKNMMRGGLNNHLNP